jgi:hypothetical protein
MFSENYINISIAVFIVILLIIFVYKLYKVYKIFLNNIDIVNNEEIKPILKNSNRVSFMNYYLERN